MSKQRRVYGGIEDRRSHMQEERDGIANELDHGATNMSGADGGEQKEEGTFNEDTVNFDGLDPYASDYSYEECEEFVRDPVGFKAMVYGHSKEDLAHVPKSEQMPEIIKVATEGNINHLKCIVETSVSHEDKMKLINSARMQVQTEYWREELKVFKCFGTTPLIAAASKGHHDIVQFLLSSGADPTLKGCVKDIYTDHSHITALDAANRLLGSTLGGGSTGYTKEAVEKCSKPRRCVDLLTVASYFWEESPYSSCGYDETKRSVFTNCPGNNFREALETVPPVSEYPKNAMDGTYLKEKYAKKKPKMMCSSCREAKTLARFSTNQVDKGELAMCMACVYKEKKNNMKK